MLPTHNSELISRRFPAWHAGRHPHRHMILGTYNDTFAKEFGGEVREIMNAPTYRQVFPEVKFRTGSKAKDYMVLQQGGRMAFIGRGGSGTGKPADLFLVDDPIKNAEEAESPTTRRALHEWFSKVAFSRCHAASAIVIVQTRWHEDDLIGRLCDPDNPEHDPEIARAWDYMNIPAVLGEGSIADAMGVTLEEQTDKAVVSMFGTKPIAALWPERFPLRHLAEAKRMNPRGFEALYQGRPAPEDGEYFKKEWIVPYHSVDELPDNLNYYGASDHAVSEKQERDPTLLGCVGVDENEDIWVMPDLVWEHMLTDRTVEELIMQMRTHKPLVWWLESELISKSFGPFLHKRMLEEKVFCTIDPQTPSKDKRVRARAIQGRMAMRKVRFPVFAPWWSNAQSELLKFPYAAHDEFVDFMAWVGLGLMKEFGTSKPRALNDNGAPKTGTLAWVKAASQAQQRARALRKAAGGF